VFGTFALTVQNVNDAPTLANPIADQSANTGAAFTFTVAANTFTDVDAGETLTYAATRADGTALPTWLTFNPSTRTFSGTPGAADAGVLNLKVTATDSGNLSVFDLFDVTVATPNLVLTGTSGNDVLMGGAGHDQLFGLAGNDTLNGQAGNDLLDGGAGTDTMRGNSGNDTYVVDAAGDVVTELTNEGTDTVQSSITYTLGANVENLTLAGTAAINGTGNGLDNVLIGNSASNALIGGAGHDTLNGGAGNDTLVGGDGNDTYIVDAVSDVVTELANEGTDSVQSSVTFTLGANVENLTLTGMAHINGTGSSANNILLGNSGNNVLDGGSGNDTVDGGAGNDTLLGGSGNDALSGGDGVDTLVGGSGDDQLGGGAGNDMMTGGGGADQFTGGTGNDTMTGGSGNDVYNFARGDGKDTIIDLDPFVGNQDRAAFGATINPFDLVLSRQADDLRLAIHGSADQVTVRDWYLGRTNHIETIQAGNGEILLSTQVNQLIQAMAAFSQQSGLTWDQAIDQRPQDVQAVLAANWQ
jgi:Ca2+-binding RTX toxin-like protein